MLLVSEHRVASQAPTKNLEIIYAKIYLGVYKDKNLITLSAVHFLSQEYGHILSLLILKIILSF